MDIERDEAEFKPGRAPVEDSKIARVVDREVDERVFKDAFGAEVTERHIRMRILEVESKRGGAHEDLAALPDEAIIENFLAERGDNNRLSG
jgi:hypothetical protein